MAALFQRPPGSFHLYHDESWPERDRDGLEGHGVLYMSGERRRDVFQRLRDARNGYQTEVSAKRIKAGPHGSLWRVANAWIGIVLEELGKGLVFKAAFTNHRASSFAAPYPGDPDWSLHLTRALRMPVFGTAVFALRQFDHVDVTPVFDDTGNTSDKAAFQKGLVSAQRSALARRLTGSRHIPTLHMHPIEYVSSDPRVYEPDSDERVDSEFVQLVDLLLGSFKTALAGAQTGKHGRLELASDLTEALAKQWEQPWGRFATRGRSMSVTLWPDAHRLPYNPRPFRRLEPSIQRELRGLDIATPVDTRTHLH